MVGVDSPFEILGLDSDADDEEVIEAYRRRIKEAHPDHGGSAAEFRSVRAAYEELRENHRTTELESIPEDVDEQQENARVEYLNYEVLDDHGWGLDDDDLFEKAATVGLDARDYGQFFVRPRESLLEAAENRGLAWPFACRGGACANCAVAVVEGEMETSVHDILSTEMIDRGIRLSCINAPTTEEMKILYNVKHMPDLDELRLPPHRFERAHPTDD